MLLLLSPLFTRRRHHQSVHGPPGRLLSYPCPACMLPSQPWRAVRLCATGSIASLHAFHVAFYQRQSAWRLPLGFIYRSAWTPVELASLARLRWTLVAFALHPSTTKPWHRSALRVAAVPGEETSRRVGSVLGIAQSPPPPPSLLLCCFLTFVVSLSFSSFYLLVLKLTARTTMKKAGS